MSARAPKLNEEYHAFVHFLDPSGVILFTDDHVPDPPPSSWHPGESYGYTRTVLVPSLPFPGKVNVRMGLFRASGKGDRLVLEGQDEIRRAYLACTMEVLPQTPRNRLVHEDGWYGLEAPAGDPFGQRRWMRREATVSFRNRKRDVMVFLEADTNYRAFPRPPVLTVSVGETGVIVPIQDSRAFLKKIRFPAGSLGRDRWATLRLSMNQSFVPKDLGLNDDNRELSLWVHYLYVARADELGPLLQDGALEAAPLRPTLARQ